MRWGGGARRACPKRNSPVPSATGAALLSCCDGLSALDQAETDPSTGGDHYDGTEEGDDDGASPAMTRDEPPRAEVGGHAEGPDEAGDDPARVPLPPRMTHFCPPPRRDERLPHHQTRARPVGREPCQLLSGQMIVPRGTHGERGGGRAGGVFLDSGSAALERVNRDSEQHDQNG